MFQFDKWPADDLRLCKQDDGNGSFYYLVYSFQMDVLTPASEQELEQLWRMDVQEIASLPE